MERQDAMTRRPSLLAGGPEPAGAATRERVLPLIDRPAGAGTRVRGTPPSRIFLLLALLGLVAVAAAWLWRPSSPRPRPIVNAPLVVAGDVDDVPAGTATIIDDGALPTEVAVGPTALPATGIPATNDPDRLAAPVSPFARTTPASGNATANPFTSGPAPVADTPRRSQPQAAPEPGGSTGPALLATLLEHIRTPPEARSGMDRMVDQLDRDDVAQATSAPIAGPGFRSHQIQMNLRECPPANTARGVACRKAICEVYAGRDPACPAG